MFNVLERYIAKTIFFATGFSALLITAVLMLTTLLGEVKSLGKGDYGLSQAIFYVLLRMPNEVYQFSPMLILLGCIIGLSIRQSYSELAVMRASGLSMARITMTVLFAALLLTVIVSVIGEWFGPGLSYKATIQRSNALNGGQTVITATGVWVHIDNNFIHVQSVVGPLRLEGITRYKFDNEHHLQAAFFAKTLTYQDHQWQMNNVIKTSFYKERTKSESFLHLPWHLKLNTNLFNVNITEPKEMTLPRLSQFARYLEKNRLQAAAYQYDFWQRIFQPLSSLVMIFLAIPFVLSARHQAPLGIRLLIGITTGLAFFILNDTLGQLCIVYQLPPSLAASFPPILFIFFGVLLSNRLVKK
jgi:lipopolysaccharide export system permease protein